MLAALTGLSLLALVGYLFKFWPLLPLALIVGIIAVNFRFYWFFLNQKHQLLLAVVLPLHLLYYLYCGLAFGIGVSRHTWKSRKIPFMRQPRRPAPVSCITAAQPED